MNRSFGNNFVFCLIDPKEKKIAKQLSELFLSQN